MLNSDTKGVKGFWAFAPWIQLAPKSVGKPKLVEVHTRPPIRSRASSKVTLWPFCCNFRAAAIPAMPPPTTTTSLPTASGKRAKNRIVMAGAMLSILEPVLDRTPLKLPYTKSS